jgi:transposase
MQYKLFIGIDVSKDTLDICVMAHEKIVAEFKISNNANSLKTILKQTKGIALNSDDALWCMENTGIYGNLLLCQLCEKKLNLWVENPMQISKRSLGIQKKRTLLKLKKNDKIDALRMEDAKYAFKNQSDAKIAYA